MTGYSASAVGSWAYNVGLSVYVYDQTHSATWVGAVTIGRLLPSVLFGSYGGVLAERFERTRLMVALDAICAVLMAALAVVVALDGPAWLAIAIGGANALFAMTYEPAVAAITPELVPEDDLAAANTLYGTVSNLAVIAGPALGAVLFAVGSPTFAFAVNAASFLLSAGLVSRISARSAPVDVTDSGSLGPLRQMLVGSRAIFSSRTATVLAAYSVVASFVYGVDTVLLVVVSERRLGTGAKGYGYLLAGLGVGGVLAASLVKRIAAWPRLATAILTAMAVFCLPTLALVIVRQPVIAFALEMLRGGGTLVVDVLAVTALQRSLPKDKLARVFGAFFTFVLLGIALGALLAPPVLSVSGLDTALCLEGALVPVLCLAGWPWLHRMDEANVAQLAEIEPRLALLQRAAMLAESSRSTLENLARGSTMLDVGPGHDVVTEGDDADALYVIEAGTVSVRSYGSGGEEVHLATLGPGDYFGEIGLVHRIPRTATVTTSSPTRLLRVEGTAFLDALSSGMATPSLLEGAQARLALTRAHLQGRPDIPVTPPPGELPAL
jgi:predicted MFS family arabinose efflux permease